MTRTVLLTGASGFVGRKVLEQLQSPANKELFQVIALSSKTGESVKTITYHDHKVDPELFSREGIGNIDVVIHAGAFTPKTSADANDFRSISNVTFTESLLGALPGTVSTIVYLSTMDVYENDGSVLHEASPVAPGSLYGLSKWMSERVVSLWAEKKGVACVILRVGNIYGPGEGEYGKLVPQTIKTIRNGGRPVIYGSGEEKRSFLFVDDCAQAIVRAIETGVPGVTKVVNVASGDAISVQSVVKTIMRLMNMEGEPTFSKASIVSKDVVFDASLMMKTLGAPLVSFEEGLLQEIADMTHES